MSSDDDDDRGFWRGPRRDLVPIEEFRMVEREREEAAESELEALAHALRNGNGGEANGARRARRRRSRR